MVLAPGVVSAYVHGSRPRPYRVSVWLRQFDDDEWDRFLGAVVAKAAHAAALLDGELDPGIVEDARAVGVELLPDAGELVPRCSCPDWADPCKHSAAVCYLVAQELDVDPFALLTLRGMSREQVLAELRRRRGAVTEVGEPAVEPPEPVVEEGVRASEAWSRDPGPLPEVPPARSRPGRLAVWPVDPPPNAPFTAEGLAAVADDAVVRAWEMSRGEGASALGLDSDTDLVRRAAAVFGTPAWGRLARSAGVDFGDLSRRTGAWRHAGEDGLRVIAEPRWRPDATVMAEARNRLVQLGVPPGRIKIDRNALVTGPFQFRLGHDGRWWPFTKLANRWELTGPSAEDIEELWEG
jgi:hypothetical protein